MFTKPTPHVHWGCTGAVFLWLLTCFICPAKAVTHDPLLKPFYHGVASGDPMHDRVIIWTRVTPESVGSVAVNWKVATDPAMQTVVKSGVFVTDGSRDYTVKIDVDGLNPGSTYYYMFTALGKNSLVGRTKTTPLGDVEQLRFAVVSCNNYEGGYFSAFGRIADRNDLDAVIHLGDYIYEYGQGEYGAPGLIKTGERTIEPKNEIVTPDDYRKRYALYRLDPDLRRAHQQHPFITVWDDHESANDAFEDGAENHEPETEGSWNTRKEVSRKVYSEWMPIRGNADPIYRTKSFGNLVDLIMIDTRIEGRDEQINDITNPALYDPNRTLLGPEQRQWLFDQLKTSKAKWKVIGNQVIFSEFNVGWAAGAFPGTPEQLEGLFLDIWDGYPAERQRVINYISENKIDDVVILTGDFHSSFAFDVAPDPSVFSRPGQVPQYDPATGKGSVAVEFVTPSISSANFDENVDPQASAGFEFQINKPLPPQAGPFAGVNPNPHMKYTDLDRHGYFILDLKKDRAQADWYFVNDILKPNSAEGFDAGFYTLSGENRLQKAAAPSTEKPQGETPAPAPERPNSAGTASNLGIQLLGTYKTGVFDEGAAEIGAYDPQSRRLFVVNAAGSVDVLDIKKPSNPQKLFSIDIEKLTGGTPNSVAAKNGIVAVAIEIEDESETQLPGRVAFFDASMPKAPTQAKYMVTVGFLPDMLTFTSDGTKVLVANEGEQGETANPEGSVSIIDITGGIASAKVTMVDFKAFNGKENELRAKGIRIFPNQKVSEDVEPEYIAVSPDGKQAFVTLQEANAFAVLDIAKAQFLDIVPLGYKDHSRGKPSLKQYNFMEPAIGKKLNGEDILFGGLSGVFFEKEENGKYIFVTVPDRGPNGDETPAGRPFLKPDYVAEVIRFSLDKHSGEVKVIEKIALKRKEGDTEKAITGFPNIPGFDEKPIDEAGNPLPYDPFGADLEGVVVAPDKSYWMVDEYRPAIYHFSPEGLLLHRFVPKGTAALALPAMPAGTYGIETLPAEYAKRRSNRGFEAMALDTDKGILYAFIQTPLANPNRLASDNSSVIRILGINPADGTPVAEYVYLLEKPLLRKSNVDKMGDAAYDAKTGKIYVIERDDNADPDNKKYIFEIDLSGATNLLAPGAPTLQAGKTLEQHTPDELAALGIKSVYKTKVVNLPSIGYLPSDKPEGLTILPDGSLVVLNDNDFGLGGPALSTVGLGIISFEEGNTLDAGDEDNGINLKNWPVLGMYMPDGVASFVSEGKTYYVTANEGDSRGEEVRAGNSKVALDTKAFTDAAALQTPAAIGRLEVSEIDGDIDGDGDYDKLYTYGARSFSIWDAYGNQVFDSSDDLEKITAIDFPEYFNASNTNNELDSRSDAKGPEPEGVAIGVLKGRTYAFVGLERIGGFMVYDISVPADAKFVTYINNRNFEADPETAEAGDLGPEGLLFIDEKESPSGEPLLVVTNEVSGTTSIYGIEKDTEVFELRLVNSTADTVITTLKDGAVIDYAEIMTSKINIQAIVSPTGVGSVLFELNGEKVNIDNPKTFSLFGDINGNFNDWTPALGEYTLKATPYSKPSGNGETGVPLTISFKVVNTAAIAGFTLINAENTSDIQELKDGQVINLKALPSTKLSVRANASPEKVGSVVFSLNNQLDFITENIQPYALFRNQPNNVDYNSWTPEPGKYTITAKPYSEERGKGLMGKPATITVTFVDEPVVTKLVLVNAATGQEVKELEDGQIVDLNKLGIRNFNVRAKVSPEKVDRVVFSLNDKDMYQRENNLPYELFGNGGSASMEWQSEDGKYLVKATPYIHQQGKRVAGIPLSVSFELKQTTDAAARKDEANAAQSLQNIKQINLYPNPVKDKLTLEFGEAVSGKLDVKIYDILNRKAYLETQLQVEGQNQVTLNVSALPARYYIIRVKTGSTTHAFRFLKE